MRRFARDSAGSVQIEYVLIGALVALAIIAGVGSIGNRVARVLNTTATALAN